MAQRANGERPPNACGRLTAEITAEAIRMLADITSSMSGKIDGLVGATNNVAAASNRAADAGYQAAAASNRAADVASMGKQHDA